MESGTAIKRKLVPTALHWIAAPLFLLGLAASFAAYQSPENQYSELHLVSLPVALGASPYLALAAIYIFSFIWHLLAYVEFRLVGALKSLWRNKNT